MLARTQPSTFSHIHLCLVLGSNTSQFRVAFNFLCGSVMVVVGGRGVSDGVTNIGWIHTWGRQSTADTYRYHWSGRLFVFLF